MPSDGGLLRLKVDKNGFIDNKGNTLGDDLESMSSAIKKLRVATLQTAQRIFSQADGDRPIKGLARRLAGSAVASDLGQVYPVTGYFTPRQCPVHRTPWEMEGRLRLESRKLSQGVDPLAIIEHPSCDRFAPRHTMTWSAGVSPRDLDSRGARYPPDDPPAGTPEYPWVIHRHKPVPARKIASVKNPSFPSPDPARKTMKQIPLPQSQPRTLRYRGDQLVLIEKNPHGCGPDALVCFDFDGDGHFEQEVRADAEGRYSFALDVRHLTPEGVFSMFTRAADGKEKSEVVTVHAIQEKPCNPACEVPRNRVSIEPVPGENKPPDTGICTSSCIACATDDTLAGDSLDAYAHSATPTAHGVELGTGKLRQSWSMTAFDTRQLGFDFSLHHSSLVDYDGPWGRGFSHGFNMMIVQDSPHTGQIITTDLRCYPIYSEDGHEWGLPRGFFSNLQLDTKRCRWTMTHFSGLEVEFFQGALNKPGYPLSICDPNGNTTYLEYDNAGLLQCIFTDLHQAQRFAYDDSYRLRAFTDHLGRVWQFGYDEYNRLTRMLTPATEYADIAACQEISDRDLPDVQVKQPRMTLLGYADERFPSHITAITDPRGATPEARVYDTLGRVRTTFINRRPVHYHYDVDFALDKLEPTNLVTRVIDREGNVNDYEIHGTAGSALNGRGRFGLRRRITWTERGKGNAPLREAEPDYWEQRWLHDCNCLAPVVTTQPFSNEDAKNLRFDDNGIPVNWPRTVYTYNDWRQVLVDLCTDGSESIRTESAYQEQAFGNKDQYSRKIRWIEPRGFDDNLIYTELNFVHTYQYDARGNRTQHDSPTVTRGVDTPQVITESWTYNEFGQVLQHLDANGNVTANTYYDGPSTGGDMNTKGAFSGYLQSVTRGAEGSRDAATHLTTTYKINPLGMTTQEIDPKGFVHDTEYNDLQERTRWIEPPVTLRNGARVRYETRCVYDGDGNKVLDRRSNIDLDGSLPANAWIDRSMSYDDVNNLLSERVEVDANDANDLITRHAYDGNDDPIITRKPEGNREFVIHDERRLLFKTFHGVASGARITDGYPRDKRAVDLGDTAFVGLTLDTHDARLNAIRHRDGRGNCTNRFYDFHNRQTAEVDPNGNGWVRTYDDASNVVKAERGAASSETGRIVRSLERTYVRFDEANRPHQVVRDINLDVDQGADVDPDDGKNSSYRIVHDPGSRIIWTCDANGNASRRTYDAADRVLAMTDALGNVKATTYDANSNPIYVEETEVPGSGADGQPETYVMTYTYDELNRRTEQHIRGLDGTSIDHTWFFAYDSRRNIRRIWDAEGTIAQKTYDDYDREIRMQRFDGDPIGGNSTELSRQERSYDRNSRLVEERAFTAVNDPSSAQVTRYAYDAFDRRTRAVFPDSDDPIDGGGPGSDGRSDRIEIVYDENSNPIRVVEQRGVIFSSTFDPGNRLTEQVIDRPPDVPGTAQQAFGYDALNRLVGAQNDYARVDRTFDSLSRLVAEEQRISRDGSGSPWKEPIGVLSTYDRQSNRTACRVLDGRRTDLDMGSDFDALNRVQRVTARYFGTRRHDIATYAYIGPSRVRTRTLGNGAVLTRAYDVKRRVRAHQWTGGGASLVGFAYAYDRMDNVLSERFNHDEGRFDRFTYDARHELIKAAYRANSPEAPSGTSDVFFNDDLLNRRQARLGYPFDGEADVLDCYASNAANEYLSLKRNGRAFAPRYDRAGHMTCLPIKPLMNASREVVAAVQWDAFGLPFTIDIGSAAQKNRYDPFRRRISDGTRRFIYDGWSVVEERLLDDGTTPGAAPSKLERIYVNGSMIDEPLLTAIDRDGDGKLGIDGRKNAPDAGSDQEYYFLNNRLGSVMALLDADAPDHLLECYRYTAYGEVTALAAAEGDSTVSAVTVPSDRLAGPSRHGNPYFFTARRLDPLTGLYYYRNRYFDPRTGRFISRDPVGYREAANLYQYARLNPQRAGDPMGTSSLFNWQAETRFLELDWYVFSHDIATLKYKIDWDCDAKTGKLVKNSIQPRVRHFPHKGGALYANPVRPSLDRPDCCFHAIIDANATWDPDYVVFGAAAGAILFGVAGFVIGAGGFGAAGTAVSGPGGLAAAPAGAWVGVGIGVSLGAAVGALIGQLFQGVETAYIYFELKICCPNKPYSASYFTYPLSSPYYEIDFEANDNDWEVNGNFNTSRFGRHSFVRTSW